MMAIVIAGPTASGKSSLAIDLALKHGCEIICADSRQFYRGMNIGTACPSDEDLKRVVHHGYGILDPANDKIDAGFFIRFAREKIEEIQSKKRRPILVGGTGLYLRALRYGLQDVPKSDDTITRTLVERCEKNGLDALYHELMTKDPKSSLIIKPTDRYRIMRALEIFEITKRAPSSLRHSFLDGKPQINAHWIYKKPDKKDLSQKIEGRVATMFEQGLTEEALRLRKQLPEGHWALDVMGYQEAILYVKNELDLKKAIERTAIRHRQYAKRQYTWFNKESFYRWIIPK